MEAGVEALPPSAENRTTSEFCIGGNGVSFRIQLQRLDVSALVEVPRYFGVATHCDPFSTDHMI